MFKNKRRNKHDKQLERSGTSNLVPEGGVEKTYLPLEEKFEKLKEIVSEGAKNIKQKANGTAMHAADDFIYNNYADADKIKAGGKLIFSDAVENLDMALEEHHLDTPFARQHTIFNSANELSPVLREHVKKRIYEQLADDYGKNCVNTTRGIYFESDSESSKKIAESKAVRH